MCDVRLQAGVPAVERYVVIDKTNQPSYRPLERAADWLGFLFTYPTSYILILRSNAD